MRTSGHIVVSASIGLFIYAAYGEVGPALASFLVGTLIDLDHIIDYLYAHGKRWDWKKVNSAHHEKVSGKLYVPLHSYELVLLFFLLTLDSSLTPWRVGISSSLIAHFLCDQFFNPNRKFSTYFLIHRIIHKFDASKVLKTKLKTEELVTN
ncbi:MAG: hypothetical protein HYR97_05115 [Candidatus Melainabacteria bacterium]|nr:hypothetical protein [Candidatus Melainabacteria bacterium]MBI3308471.1 hypothetical protein [Candidatus Melainabacteria bacterium]